MLLAVSALTSSSNQRRPASMRKIWLSQWPTVAVAPRREAPTRTPSSVCSASAVKSVASVKRQAQLAAGLVATAVELVADGLSKSSVVRP